jgi:hypothetical protein
LPDQPITARAHGRADGDFATARGGAREQKVRDIGAPDEEQKTDGGKKEEQDRPDSADDFLVQRDNLNPDVAVINRILNFEAAANRIHFGAGLVDGDAGFQPAKNIEVVAASDWPRIDIRPDRVGRDSKGRRNPKLPIAVRDKIWRHHPDDGVRLVVQGNLPADDATIGRVPARPQLGAQDDDKVMPGLLVRWKKRAAKDGGYTEKRKQTGRGHRAADALGTVAVGKIEALAAGGGQVRENVVLPHPIEVVRGRGSAAGCASAARRLGQRHDFFGLRIRQRMEKHAVDHAEDGRGAGDAEGERDERREGEAGILQQHSNPVAKIGEECVHI